MLPSFTPFISLLSPLTFPAFTLSLLYLLSPSPTQSVSWVKSFCYNSAVPPFASVTLCISYDTVSLSFAPSARHSFPRKETSLLFLLDATSPEQIQCMQGTSCPICKDRLSCLSEVPWGQANCCQSWNIKNLPHGCTNSVKMGFCEDQMGGRGLCEGAGRHSRMPTFSVPFPPFLAAILKNKTKP